jgi:hypothetical protein
MLNKGDKPVTARDLKEKLMRFGSLLVCELDKTTLIIFYLVCGETNKATKQQQLNMEL